jgi:hypothetical protein
VLHTEWGAGPGESSCRSSRPYPPPRRVAGDQLIGEDAELLATNRPPEGPRHTSGCSATPYTARPSCSRVRRRRGRVAGGRPARRRSGWSDPVPSADLPEAAASTERPRLLDRPDRPSGSSQTRDRPRSLESRIACGTPRVLGRDGRPHGRRLVPSPVLAPHSSGLDGGRSSTQQTPSVGVDGQPTQRPPSPEPAENSQHGLDTVPPADPPEERTLELRLEDQRGDGRNR